MNIYFFFLGVLLSFRLTAQQANADSSRPNIIIIYTDDQGTLDLNSYGAKDLYTPNLDQLAEEGMRFTNFYSTSSICSPSRASLLTGRYPQRAGLSGNASSTQGKKGMPAEQLTIAEHFRAGGYKTAHIGKWHLGYTPETMPNAQGFDHSFGFMGGCIDNYSHFFYWDGPNRHDLWRNGQEVWEPGKYFPDLMVQEARQFIAANRQQPFLLYFASNLPHYPMQGEPKWLDYYSKLPMPRRAYAAAVSTMDEKIGDLMKILDEFGLTRNTILVFQSDQGHSEEERAFSGGGYAGEFRGSKFSFFEGGIKVPAIIRWPGKIEAGAVRHQFAANIDWFPTLSEYARLSQPAIDLDGRSIVPLIASADAPTRHEKFFWAVGGQEDQHWAVRFGEWKLLHKPRQSVPEELYKDLMLINLREDSSERLNVAKTHPDIVDRLKREYEGWRKDLIKSDGN